MNWLEGIKNIIELMKNDNSNQLNAMMAPKFVSGDEAAGICTIAFDINDWQLNPRGSLHGGACATAFDIATGIACCPFSEGRQFVTTDMNISYIGMMTSNDRLLITTKIVKAGKTLLRFYSEGYSENTGKLIATASVSYFIINK